jgi:hypothetical protein
MSNFVFSSLYLPSATEKASRRKLRIQPQKEVEESCYFMRQDDDRKENDRKRSSRGFHRDVYVFRALKWLRT